MESVDSALTRTDPAPRRRASSSERRVAVVISLLQSGNYRRICGKAGLTPQHVARVLQGRKGASFHVAARIAKAAGVTLDEMHAFIAASPALEVKGRRTVADDAAGT